MSTIPAISSPTSGGISTDTSRLGGKENLEAAGKRFEAIFTNMMLKSMRQAKLGDGLFDSKAGDQFRDMQDQKLSQSMAEHAPIGIGKAMTDFLSRAAAAQAPASAPAPDAAPAETNGSSTP